MNKLLSSYCKIITKYFYFSGGYDMEEKAARSYDLAALKYWGPATHINFPVLLIVLEVLIFLFRYFVAYVEP